MEIEELIRLGEEVMDFYDKIPGIISGDRYRTAENKLKLTKYKGWRERVLQYVYYNNFSRYSEFKEYFQKLESSPDLNAYTDIMGILSVYYVKEKKENKIATNEHKVGSDNVLIKQSSDDGFHEISVKNSDRPINVVYNNILINYIESLYKTVNEGLTVEQIKELKRIIEGNSDNESKKKSICDKLLSFGSDVAANILANLITKPDILALLF